MNPFPHFSAKPARCSGSVALLLCILLLAWIPNGQAASIVTTLPPLTGLVLLLDPEADVHCLLPPGADAHDFQITPKQAQLLNSAGMLLRSSYDDRHWSGLQGKKAVFDLWPDQGHAWLSPRSMRQRLPALAGVLQELAPQRSEQIADGLKRALAICDAVEAEWNHALSPYHQTGVIMQHNAWQAMLKDFNVPVWGVLETGHHGDDIGPRRLEHALQWLREHPNTLLWGNQRHPDRALTWLQAHQGATPARLLRFDPLGDCGITWPQLMQRNLDILAGRETP